MGKIRPPIRMRASTMQMPSLGSMSLRQPPIQQRRAGLPSRAQVLPKLPNFGGGGGNGRVVGSGGRLSAAERRALPDSAFAGPNRTFPITDAGHAKAAKALIKNAPPSARPKIQARANAKLGKPKAGKGGGNHPVGCGCGNHGK
jgi:hypothetical protein